MSDLTRCFWCGGTIYNGRTCETCMSRQIEENANARHDGREPISFNPSLPFKSWLTKADHALLDAVIARLKGGS